MSAQIHSFHILVEVCKLAMATVALTDTDKIYGHHHEKQTFHKKKKFFVINIINPLLLFLWLVIYFTEVNRQ